MGTIAEDGNVFPNFLGVSNMATDPSSNAMYSLMADLGLRVGVVVATYAPTDDKNTSKRVWQYDVVSSVSDGAELSVPQQYPRCVVASLFGGVADFLRWKPRFDKQTTDQDDGDDGRVSNNSYVLLACPNGDSRYGYIIGAIPHPNSEPDPEEDPPGEAYCIAQYNGVNITINNDGELVVTRKGPTKVDGTAVEDGDEKAGAKISLFKNGDISVENSKGDKILMNYEDRGIEIHTDKDINIISDSGKIITQSSGVQLGGDSEHLIKGDTYRKAEDQFFQDINDFMQKLIIGLGTVGAGLILDAGAAAAMTTLVGQLAPSLKALPTFKAQATTYLSRDNTTG